MRGRVKHLVLTKTKRGLHRDTNNEGATMRSDAGPNQDQVRRLATLFSGRTDVWGAIHGEAVKEAVTLGHYERHLRGETSLGIYPLLADG
jgi:hypothetical protein